MQDSDSAHKRKKKNKRGSVVIAPLPISSPAIGNGIVPVLAYIFPFSEKDKDSPPSVIGAAGLITNNGSRGFALVSQLYLIKLLAITQFVYIRRPNQHRS